MTDDEYYTGVRELLDVLIINCAELSFNIDLLNDISIETNKRLNTGGCKNGVIQ